LKNELSATVKVSSDGMESGRWRCMPRIAVFVGAVRLQRTANCSEEGDAEESRYTFEQVFLK
jgi:hypothetical protein